MPNSVIRKILFKYSSLFLLFCGCLFPVLWSTNALADWTNIAAAKYGSGIYCPNGYNYFVSREDDYITFKPGCSFSVGEGNSVPVSGMYSLASVITYNRGNGSNLQVQSGQAVIIDSNPQYLEAYKDLGSKPLVWQWPAGTRQRLPGNVFQCIYLIGPQGDSYTLNNTPMSCTDAGNSGNTPLPPAPVITCSINNGSALNVAMGEVSRSDMGVAPGTLPGVEKKFDVTCSGGSATYSVKFQYTPIKISGKDLVTSSTAGLGIAMSLNDELVNTTDTYTRTYGVGTQTESLKFEPVRDPSVNVGDISTGAFTASAVMVFTMQ